VKDQLWEYAVDSTGSRYGTVAGCYECCGEPSGFSATKLFS
jgi:hypothetical protein